jgi:hypothetical protein
MPKPVRAEDLATSARQIAELWLSGHTPPSGLPFPTGQIPLPGQAFPPA